MDRQPIRKRLHRWEVEGSIRFVTFSCHRRLPLLGQPAIRDLFTAELAEARREFAFELFAWVAMPEHIHILLRPRDGILVDSLRSLKTSVAKQVITRWRALDTPMLDRIRTHDNACRFWQKGGGFDRNVRDSEEFCREIRYIHHNPVERGLVESPTDWAWSSARWWTGSRVATIHCDPPPGDPRAWAAWRAYV